MQVTPSFVWSNFCYPQISRPPTFELWIWCQKLGLYAVYTTTVYILAGIHFIDRRESSVIVTTKTCQKNAYFDWKLCVDWKRGRNETWYLVFHPIAPWPAELAMCGQGSFCIYCKFSYVVQRYSGIMQMIECSEKNLLDCESLHAVQIYSEITRMQIVECSAMHICFLAAEVNLSVYFVCMRSEE